MSDWEVGNRVQTDKDGVFRVGEVTAVETHEVERTRRNYNYGSLYGKEEKYMETEIKSINVKWDDGEEQTLGQWDVYPEDSEMERTFRLAVDDAQTRIDEKLAIARKALREAEAISEETGIPFRSGISPLGQSYYPSTTSSIFPDVDGEFINELAGTYHSDGGDEGWQHSAVC